MAWVLLMAAFQILNFNIVWMALREDRLALTETLIVIAINVSGLGLALYPRSPKGVGCLWVAIYFINLSLVGQGLIKMSVEYGWDIALSLFVGVPLFFVLNTHLIRKLAEAVKTDRATSR
jgi:hypothetical protein